MKIRHLKTKEEVYTCVRMYINYTYEIPGTDILSMNEEVAFKNLNYHARSGKFVRALVNDDDKIIAWLYADKSAPQHTDEIGLQQVYYACNQHGKIAVDAVKLLHREMVEYARNRNVPILFSQGSPFDEKNVFTRILEKDGWTRFGFLAVKRLLS
jgi:hypothetical protein